MGSRLGFHLDDPHLIKAPQGVGDEDSGSKQKNDSEDFDYKNFKKIDKKIIQWMLEHDPLVFLQTILKHSQDEGFLLKTFGLHEILAFALMKTALTGIAQKVLQTKGLFSGNKAEREKAIVHLVLGLPTVKKSLKKASDLCLTPKSSNESIDIISKILSSNKKSSE